MDVGYDNDVGLTHTRIHPILLCIAISKQTDAVRPGRVDRPYLFSLAVYSAHPFENVDLLLGGVIVVSFLGVRWLLD